MNIFCHRRKFSRRFSNNHTSLVCLVPWESSVKLPLTRQEAHKTNCLPLTIHLSSKVSDAHTCSSLSNSTGRSNTLKQETALNPPHTLYSVLLGFTVRGRILFFFYGRVKSVVRDSSNTFRLQYICSAHCYRTPGSTVPSDISAEPFTANNTVRCGLRGLFCKEEKSIWAAALPEDSLHLLYLTSTPVSSLR